MPQPIRKFSIHPAIQKPPGCAGCILEYDGTGFARPEGSGTLRVLIIGEALGPNEAREGLPFRPNAPAGSVLERAFRSCGFNREQFVIFNVVNCLPPNMELSGAPYELQAAQHCRIHLLDVVRRFQPKCILALGAVALRSLTGHAGKKQSIEHLRGFALSSPEPEFDGIPIVSSFHPSYIVRGAWQCFPVLCRDMKYAVQIAKNGFHPPAVEFYEHAGLSELEWLKQRCLTDETLPVSVDFETEVNLNVFEDVQLLSAMEELYGEEDAKKKLKKKDKIGTEQPITQVNISVKENESFVFQATQELMQGCAELLAMPNPKVTYNGWNFDGPVAVWNGMPLAGPQHDVIWLFHHLWPDLPGKRGKVQGELEGSLANLQFAASMYGWWMPWKHLVEERPEYYGCHDSAATLMLFNVLKRELQTLRYQDRGMTLWDGYLSMVFEIQPILARMKERGLPVNKTKMLEFLKSVVMRQRGVGDEIQKVVPEELCTANPKSGYAKKPTKKCESCKGKGEELSGVCHCGEEMDTGGVFAHDGHSSVEMTRRCEECNGTGHVDKFDSLTLRDFHFDPTDERCKCNKIRKKDIVSWSQSAFADYDDKGRLRAPDPDCNDCGGSGWIKKPERIESRWCRLLPFNPNSPPQMRSYAALHHHKVPKNSKMKYAMDKETVEKLARSTGDPLYKKCIEFREFEKMRTYALGWMPGDDGLIHATGSFFPATGQFSYTDPNIQTAPNVGKYGPLAEQFRTAIEAPDGYCLLEFDKKSYHAQTLGFEADCPEYIRLAKIDIHSYLATQMIKAEHCEYALEWSDGELKEWLSWYKKNFKLPDGTPFQKIRDKQAKPCIAQGQLVLTDEGLVPIEQVLLRQKVWDGVEFVSHEGVVCKGLKEVMTYDGLTATPDHQVFIDFCTKQGFASTAQKGVPLYRTGNNRQPLRCNEGTLQQPERQKVLSLWSEGHTKQISFTSSFHRVHAKRIAPRQLPRSSDRQDRQQRSLRAGQSSVSYAETTVRQPQDHIENYLSRTIDAARRLQQSTSRFDYPSVGEGRAEDGGRVNRLCPELCLQENEKLERYQGPLKRAWVYDIVGAGPRHRFTVSDKLVSNCVLGYGFGMQAGKLYRLNEDSFNSEKEAKKVLDTLDATFPKVKQYRDTIPMVAKRQGGKLISRYGFIRWFWDVQKWDWNKRELVRSDDWEKCIAYLPANDAFGDMRAIMKRMEVNGMNERYGLVNNIHDALLFLSPIKLRDEALFEIKREMDRPSEVLLFKDGTGLQVDVESKAGTTWGNLKEVIETLEGKRMR